MFSPQFTITNNTTLALTQIERARGFLEAATLSEQWLEDMSARALLLEAHHTTHIEGTHLTLEQAERLWVGEAVPEADPQDTQELLNYRKAFDLVAGYLNSDMQISENLISSNCLPSASIMIASARTTTMPFKVCVKTLWI